MAVFCKKMFKWAIDITMKTFLKWLQAATAARQREIDEAVRHHMIGPTFQQNRRIPTLPTKDGIGTPELAMPGIRAPDLPKLKNESPDVAVMVDEATKRLGVHWLIMYIEPEDGTRETPSDWLWKMKRDPQNDWSKYQQYSHGVAQQALEKFVAGEEDGEHTHGEMGSADGNLKPPHPENTIVYVKPTSRVHGLSTWQQMHNIGHSVWQSNKHQLGKFVNKLREMVYKLQMSKYQKEGKKPNAWEILLTIGRLVNVRSYQRLFNLKPGDLESGGDTRANTAFNNFMEGMIEMIALYLKNKGTLPLHPRGEVVGGPDVKRVDRFGRRSYAMPTPDRVGDMDPVADIQSPGWTAAGKQAAGTFPGSGHLSPEDRTQKMQNLQSPVRDWAWKALNFDQAELNAISSELTKIIDEAILNCVWAKKGGPVYATEGYITTKP